MNNDLSPELEKFYQRCNAALNDLFARAKSVDEVQYAMSLSPEFRAIREPGWNTAAESDRSLDEFTELLGELPCGSPVRLKIALSLYCHAAEASGYYEVPKNMMRILSGQGHALWPFAELVDNHRQTGDVIAPNATKVVKDLIGHAQEVGAEEFANVLLDAFDFDIRNAYAHADYVVWQDGVRLAKRNGGIPRTVSYDDFSLRVSKAVTMLHCVRNSIANAMADYAEPKQTFGRINNSLEIMPAEIHARDGSFIVRVGRPSLPKVV